jgi:predicted GNAT family acetyltransferase
MSLVSELARSVLASGKRSVTLFTDAANPTANHIYEMIGFRFVCRYDAYTIERRA